MASGDPKREGMKPDNPLKRRVSSSYRSGELEREERELRLKEAAKRGRQRPARLPQNVNDEGKKRKVTKRRLDRVEEELKRAAKRLRSTSGPSSAELLSESLQKHTEGSEAVDLEALLDCMADLEVKASPLEAKALLKRYRRLCPKDRALLPGEFSRMLMTSAGGTDVCFGCPETDDDFSKRILHPQCRRTIFAPTKGFNPKAAADRSACEPAADLELEFAHGYAGHFARSANAFYAHDGEIVFPVAGLGVVFDRESNSQRFFRHHSSDVTCLHASSYAVRISGTEYAARSIVASGQRKEPFDPDTGVVESPFVCLWDTDTCSLIRKIPHPPDERAIVAVAFSPCGSYLASVVADNQHTVYVWDLSKKRVGWDDKAADGTMHGLVASGRGYQSKPVAVYGIAWNPFTSSKLGEFCSYGAKHLKVWETDGRCRQWKFKNEKAMDICSAVFLKPPKDELDNMERFPAIVTGVVDGRIFLWRAGRAVTSFNAHDPGPKIIAEDGHVMFGGVCSLKLHKAGTRLISGGSDGCIRLWDVSSGKAKGQVGEAIGIESPASDQPCQVKALDAIAAEGIESGFLVGTSLCDLWEISSGSAEIVIHGHAGHCFSVATHPVQEEVFASVSTTGRVFLWDANERKATRIARVGFQAICVAISHGTLSSSAKGRSHHHIVVGGRRGNLAALEESTFLRVLSEKPCKSAISDIKFSLDDRHLAVASHDCCIDLYGTPARKNGGGKYQWLRRLVGHSSTVNHVDFSRDSLLLMSASADYDLLYWNVRTGKQVTEAQRDVDWLTWTSRIGFAVMGIWPEFSDGTDINSVDRSNSKEVVATADDFGGVKIFNWPCVVANAGFRKYKGHSSHVTCARFSHSDNWLFTCGSRDRAVFQFRYKTFEPPSPPPPRKTVWRAIDESNKVYGWQEVEGGPE